MSHLTRPSLGWVGEVAIGVEFASLVTDYSIHCNIISRKELHADMQLNESERWNDEQ